MDESSLVTTGKSENPSSVSSGDYGRFINSTDNESSERRSGIYTELETNWRQNDKNVRYRSGKRLLPVFMCSLVAAIGACLNGFMLGYSSMTQINLKENFPDDFTQDNFVWIASSATLWAILGGLVAGLLADGFGRKFALIFSTFLLALGWLAIAISVEQFYWPVSGNFLFTTLVVGRALSGFGSGWLSLVVPLYIVEISPASLKGLLGSFYQFSITVGILLIYLLGTWIDYFIVALIVQATVAVFVILLQYIPETPRWLVANGEHALAKSILYKLHGPQANIKHEMEMLQKAIAYEDQLTIPCKLSLLKGRVIFVPFVLSAFFTLYLAHKVSVLKRRAILMPFFFSLCLMFFQQFSGINVIIFYAGDVVQTAGLSANQASLSADIGVGIIQVIATFISVLLVDVLGRRVLLISGGVLLTLSTACLGGYFFVIEYATNHHPDDHNWPVPHFYIVAIVCLAVFIIGFSIGWGPIPWVMMGELAPMQVRGLLSGISTAANWGFAAIITSSFHPYKEVVHTWGAWWSFTVCIALSIPFVLLFLPETKGKDLQDIQDYFGHRYGNVDSDYIQNHNRAEPENEQPPNSSTAIKMRVCV